MSNSMVERAVRSMKDVLKKTRGTMSEIQFNEMIFCLNGMSNQDNWDLRMITSSSDRC